MDTLTTIAICAYNMASTLKEALCSALSQHGARTEILVVDDGSTDSTSNVLSHYKNHPRVRLFSKASNQGLTASRNLVLEHARGKYLSILDADDMLAPEKTWRHLECFKNHPHAQVVWGRSLMVGPSPLHSSLLPPTDYEPSWDLASPYYVAHSATTWSTDALRRSGGYRKEWELIEGVYQFFKAGDNSPQVFDPAICCLKRIRPSNPFRTQLQRQGAALQKKLVQDTLFRRYGKQMG